MSIQRGLGVSWAWWCASLTSNLWRSILSCLLGVVRDLLIRKSARFKKTVLSDALNILSWTFFCQIQYHYDEDLYQQNPGDKCVFYLLIGSLAKMPRQYLHKRAKTREFKPSYHIKQAFLFFDMITDASFAARQACLFGSGGWRK